MGKSKTENKESIWKIIPTLFLIFLASAILSGLPFGFEFWKFRNLPDDIKNPNDIRDVYLTGIFSLSVFILLGTISAFKTILFKNPKGCFRFWLTLLFIGFLSGSLFMEGLLIYLIITPEYIPEFKTNEIIISALIVLFAAFFLEALGHSYD